MEQGTESINRAIALARDSGTLYLDRGFYYLQIRKIPETLNDFNTGIKLSRLNYSGYLGRAQIYLNAEDYDAAIADASIAIQLKPDCAEAYLIRGIAKQK